MEIATNITPYGENSQSKRESLRRAKKIISVSPFFCSNVINTHISCIVIAIETKKLIIAIENVSNKYDERNVTMIKIKKQIVNNFPRMIIHRRKFLKI